MDMINVAYFIIDHEKTELNRVFYFHHQVP